MIKRRPASKDDYPRMIILCLGERSRRDLLPSRLIGHSALPLTDECQHLPLRHQNQLVDQLIGAGV